jgi:rhamnose transport system permease protein
MTDRRRASRSGRPRWLTRHETLLAAVLIVALAILGAYNDRFLTVDNLLNQGRLMAEIGLIAMPMTFVIITGGIDLSVGSVVGLCAIALGYSWKNLGVSRCRWRDRVRARARRARRLRQRPRSSRA